MVFVLVRAVDDGLDLFGATVTTRGNTIYTCAPMRGLYLERNRNVGTCYKSEAGKGFKEFFKMNTAQDRLVSKNDWKHLVIMGHNMLVNDKSETIFTAPMARTKENTWPKERSLGTVVKASAKATKFEVPQKSVAPWMRQLVGTPKDPHRHDYTGASLVTG